MADPRILFGVGATKAGTSWLHEWLSGHPECHLRSVKEVHYFDTLEGGGIAPRLAALEEDLARAVEKSAPAQRIGDLEECVSMFRRLGDVKAYLDYLNRGRADKPVIGDITPSYGLLPVERLKAMAGLGDTRFLYILRDPVERLWSHIRMIARRRFADREDIDRKTGRILKRVLRGEETNIALRCDYRGAIERICAAVPEPRRLFVFFEELFGGDAAASICRFLGIAPAPALGSVIHAGRPLEMSPGQAARARAYLEDQYSFVERTMGRVPESWYAGKS